MDGGVAVGWRVAMAVVGGLCWRRLEGGVGGGWRVGVEVVGGWC